MDFLTLEQIKQQLRIEPDFTLEDDKLTELGEGTEQAIYELCRRTYVDFLMEYGKIPMPVVNAAKLLVDVGYTQGSPVSAQNMSVVPYGNVDILLKPYIRLSGDGDADAVQEAPIGSDVKIAFTADLPDGLVLKDIDFAVKVVNISQRDKVQEFGKSDCIMKNDGSVYVVLVDSDELGVGMLMLRLTVFIPDTDYQSGTRKEIININPHVRVTG